MLQENPVERSKNWGGAREGAGRKPGVISKYKDDVRAAIDKVVDFNKVFESLFRIATHPKRPDVFAARLLLEYRFGRPFQAVGVFTPKDEMPRIAIVQNGDDINLIVSQPMEQPVEDAQHTVETITEITNPNDNGRNDGSTTGVSAPTE